MTELTSFMDQNFSGKPFMGKTKPDVVYTFNVKVDSLVIIEVKTPWAEQFGMTIEAKGQFKNIVDEEDDEFEEDGEHVVPFWACEAFQRTVVESGKTKGWLSMEYKRNIATGLNREGKEVELSGASFKLV